jgi:orotate phosphoribosyltransferase
MKSFKDALSDLADLGAFNPPTDRDTLFDLIQERSFRKGEFTLASGQKSDHYFNLKPTLLDVLGARLCGDCMADLVSDIVYARYGADETTSYRDALPIYVSGLAVGAVPLIATMAASGEAEIRGTFVRKQAKDHGTKEEIEGLAPDDTLAGRNVIIVEDVCTTGKSALEAVEAVRRAGGIVTDAVTIIERGGREALQDQGIALHSLFTAADFLN